MWDGCVAGRADAFGVLFDRHADSVFRFCLSACGNWHDAEELVSITFLEAWRKRGTIHLRHDSLLPWLLGVASKANLNRNRAKKRHRALLDKLPKDETTTAFDLDSAVQLDAAELSNSLIKEADLSTAEHSAVVLCLMYGFTYADAARVIKVPVGTIRSRLNRAKKKLQAIAPQDLDHAMKISTESSSL